MDRRIARTRRTLQDAMLALLAERDLDAITVADLVAHADVNRSTFYQHYVDKQVLLADAIDAAIAADQADLPTVPITPETSPPTVLVHHLEHFDAHADVYARVFGEHGSPLAVARLQSRLATLAVDAIGESGTDAFEQMPVQVAAAGLAGSVIGVIGAWIALDPRPDVGTAADWVWQVLSAPGREVQAHGTDA